MKPDHERVSKLLLDTVTLLCKNGLTYDQELKVQGLIGITLDSLEVFVVHINESFGTSGAPCVTLPQNSSERETGSSTSDSDRQPSRKRHAPNQEEVVDLTRLVETPDIRPARHALPAPPSHSDNARQRQRAGPSIQSQQRSQNQAIPSPISSLADVANRMLPPQCVPAGVPRNDVSGYQIPHAPAVRNNAMVAVGGAESIGLASMNAPMLRQRYPNYTQLHSSLREEDSVAAQRQYNQRVAMENKRMTVARMAAAAQHQLVGQPSIQIAGYPSAYTAAGSMQVGQNYGMMPQRQRNPTMMQSSEQQQQQQPQALPSGSVGLPYRFAYHGNPHQYDGQARMFPPGSHVPNSIPTMLTERPRFAETSNPVQQLMLDYERLGQQSQASILGPAALSTSSSTAPFPNTSVANNNYAAYDMQSKQQPHRPMHGAPSPRDQAVLHSHIPQCDYNAHGSQGVGQKEYLAAPSSAVPTASPVRRSSRIRVEHIDLSQDIDDEVLQETLLSGLGTMEFGGVPTSSIIIQPDNIDSCSAADVLQPASPLFESSSSSSQQVRTSTSSSQQNQDNLEDNDDTVPAYNVQEILPIADGLNDMDDFDGPSDARNNGLSRSPDGKLPTGLSDSGRSTGSERMDCAEESLPAQLDGCIDDSLAVALGGDDQIEKPDQSVPLLHCDQVSQSQPLDLGQSMETQTSHDKWAS